MSHECSASWSISLKILFWHSFLPCSHFELLVRAISRTETSNSGPDLVPNLVYWEIETKNLSKLTNFRISVLNQRRLIANRHAQSLVQVDGCFVWTCLLSVIYDKDKKTTMYQLKKTTSILGSPVNMPSFVNFLQTQFQ